MTTTYADFLTAKQRRVGVAGRDVKPGETTRGSRGRARWDDSDVGPGVDDGIPDEDDT